MENLISVIIPVFNRENVITECIKSVLSQTYQNFEIVIIDDGSSDDTLTICQELASKDNRIIILKGEHHGVSHARNIGLDNANGEYLFFLDSDDIIHPNLFNALIDGMLKYNAPISGTGIVNIGEKNWDKAYELIEKDTSYGTTINKTFNEAINAIFRSNSPINLIGGVMMRKDYISDTRFKTDLFIGEDFYFVYENLIKGKNVVYLKENWYYCRIHKTNSSKNYTFEAFKSRFIRRVLVWRCEEENSRFENANIEKAESIGIYIKAINKFKFKSENYNKIKSFFKTYYKEITSTISLKYKIQAFMVLNFPHIYVKLKNSIKKIIKIGGK